jgi:hypothetical protein
VAHRVKCPECRSCLSPIWVMPNRYYYCGFCHVYYGGRDGELQIVDTPYRDKIESAKIEDPILEEENEPTNSV